MAGLNWSHTESDALLAAMLTVAVGDERRELQPVERGLIAGAARHLFDRTDVDVDALTPISGDELAAAISDADHRSTAVQLLVLVPYADTTVDEFEVEVVDEFADALDQHPATVADLHRVRDGHIKRLLLDYGRRSIGALNESSPHGLVRMVTRLVHQYVGDQRVADRYDALADFPDGSLGNTFHRFYRDRGFPLPGEHHSLGEFFVGHDSAHVLAGINTDGPGELEVAGFEAGMSRDGFGYEMLLEVILDYHMGVDFGASAAGIVPKVGEFDPDRVTDGIRRGIDCDVDLLREWDFWAVAEEPVVDLRARYGITGDRPVVMVPPATT